MGDSQEFCLRWNDFHSSFHVSLDALRGDEAFTDVTLSCSGQLLKAHRVILSACSSHFKDILREVPPQQHPVIVLPTVDQEVMRAILEFIYQGQVNVRQARLGAFLQIAETFSIQGLADDETKKNANRTPERPRAPDTGPPASSAPKRRRLEQPAGCPPSPTVSTAPAPAPAIPPPPPRRTPEKTVNLDLTVKPEPDSMLDELEDILEPQPDQRLQDVAVLDGGQAEVHALMTVGHEDSGGAQATAPRAARPGARPPVWLYYDRLSETSAACRFCQRVIRGAPTSSGNFWVHLKRLHSGDMVGMGGEHAALAGAWLQAAGRRRTALEEAARQPPLPPPAQAAVLQREVARVLARQAESGVPWCAPPPPPGTTQPQT